MKILLRHHEHPGTKRLHGKKGRKILKKMAKLEKKLEKKLGKYQLEESTEESCSSGAGSPVRSRSRGRHHRGRLHRRLCRRFASLGRRNGNSSSSSSSSNSSSDSDSCSDSGTSPSSSSDSSRLPSPEPGHRHHRYHRHHGPLRHLSRSKSFAGRGCGSPPPFGPGGHHHRHQHHQHPHHQPPHHRNHHHGHWRRHAIHRHGDGICGLLYRSLAQSEPNLPEAELLLNGGENRGEEKVAREPEVCGTDVHEGGQEGDDDGEPESIQNLSEKLLDTLKKGLLADAKKSLLQKYPVSKNRLELRGPKLNQEFLPVSSETAVKRDAVLLYQQNQIGVGLVALNQATNELNAKAEAENDMEMIPILNVMEEAAAIVADAHHNITQMRQAFLAAELNKRVRPVVDTCKADEFLFGKDFGEKVKDVRAFGKGRKGCDKKEKRKHMDQDGEKRKFKRLHRQGIVH